MAKAEEKSIHLKTGDRVIIVAGKDKGKIGNVKEALPKEGKIIVEGVNIITKATKPNPMNNIPGGLVKYEAAFNSSKAMLYCPKCEKPTRIRHELIEGDKKTRVCKKCGEQL